MSKDTSLDALYDNTVNYYNQRPILNDAPRRKPATPTKPSPKVSEENAQMDLSLGEAVCGKRVLEVACGSGSQTDKAASVAESVLATDVTPNNIEIATQNVKRSNVTFMLCDAFDLSPVNGRFSAGLASGFFHICPSARYNAFLSGLHAKLEPRSTVFMASTRPVSYDARSRSFRREGEPDQYMIRELSDGSEYVIVTNDFTKEVLTRIFEPYATSLEVHCGDFLWWVTYVTK